MPENNSVSNDGKCKANIAISVSMTYNCMKSHKHDGNHVSHGFDLEMNPYRLEWS